MNKYIIYCTPGQTKKAIELGAPIEILPNYTEYRVFPLVKCKDGNERPCIIPTAEQMRNWLEDVFSLRFYCGEDTDGFIFVNIYSPQELIATVGNCISPIHATIAAIDAALEYLSKNEK